MLTTNDCNGTAAICYNRLTTPLLFIINSVLKIVILPITVLKNGYFKNYHFKSYSAKNYRSKIYTYKKRLL